MWPSISEVGNLLCAHVCPSQPSLQMQVKVSPPPMHVPPFSHGPESHELFLAKKTNRMFSFQSETLISFVADCISKFFHSTLRWQYLHRHVSHLCCRCFHPTLRGSCTRTSLHGHYTSLHCCMCWSHIDSHLETSRVAKDVNIWLCARKK